MSLLSLRAHLGPRCVFFCRRVRTAWNAAYRQSIKSISQIYLQTWPNPCRPHPRICSVSEWSVGQRCFRSDQSILFAVCRHFTLTGWNKPVTHAACVQETFPLKQTRINCRAFEMWSSPRSLTRGPLLRLAAGDTRETKDRGGKMCACGVRCTRVCVSVCVTLLFPLFCVCFPDIC